MREKTVPEPLVNHQCAQIFQINETLIKPINSLFPIKTAHCQVVRFCWSHMKHNIIILNWTIELIQSVVIFPDSCFFFRKMKDLSDTEVFGILPYELCEIICFYFHCMHLSGLFSYPQSNLLKIR